jgi:DNA processing protein
MATYLEFVARAARAPGLSAAQLAALAACSADLSALEQLTASELAKLGIGTRAIAWLLAPDHAQVDCDLHWASRTQTHLIAVHDPHYPALLRQSAGAPPVLFVRGRIEALSEPQLAMVGSRNPSAGGKDTARDFAAFFAHAGLTITSGLALGIDAACHEGALAAHGLTIAVCGHGLDSLYPKEHQSLAERIIDSGAVVSEFPPGVPPLRGNFPQRNRVIAGLALGTLVVEAARDSGSLITARFAGEAGREVFAIPGSIHNPLSRGCHQLIRQGAKLVESGADVLGELQLPLLSQVLAPPLTATSNTSKPAPPLDNEYKILLDALAFEPTSVDTLVERTGLPSESVASMLLILELEARVQPHPGGRFSRTPGP